MASPAEAAAAAMRSAYADYMNDLVEFVSAMVPYPRRAEEPDEQTYDRKIAEMHAVRVGILRAHCPAAIVYAARVYIVVEEGLTALS